MEAFILADRVLALTHSAPARPKYLKRYDLPPRTPSTPQRLLLPRRPLAPANLLNAPRTKDLLATLACSQTDTSLSSSNHASHPLQNPKMDKYFTIASQPSRQALKKPKSTLLIKRLQPHAQQYDASFDPVSRRAPCWGFMPERTQATSSATPEEMPARAIGTVRVSRPRRVVFGEVLEREEERLSTELKGRGDGIEPRLQYSSSELGRCTALIFKKYRLEKDNYFKKFLADLKQSE